jgi:hypothetical protein
MNTWSLNAREVRAAVGQTTPLDAFAASLVEDQRAAAYRRDRNAAGRLSRLACPMPIAAMVVVLRHDRLCGSSRRARGWMLVRCLL